MKDCTSKAQVRVLVHCEGFRKCELWLGANVLVAVGRTAILRLGTHLAMFSLSW